MIIENPSLKKERKKERTKEQKKGGKVLIRINRFRVKFFGCNGHVDRDQFDHGLNNEKIKFWAKNPSEGP